MTKQQYFGLCTTIMASAVADTWVIYTFLVIAVCATLYFGIKRQ